MKKKNIVEAIEKLGKDNESINQFDVIPEVKPEDVSLQAVAPVSYVAAVEQSKREKDKFIKMIDEKTKNAQGLDNKDEDRFKHMSKETGKSTLNVDQPGLKKMHLDESLFESVTDVEYKAINESKETFTIKSLDEDEKDLNSLASKYNIDIIAFDDIKHFQVAGKVGDIKDFDNEYKEKFGKYLDESLNENLLDDIKKKLASLFKKKKLDNYIDISDIVDDVVTIYNTSTPKDDGRYKMRAESLTEGVQYRDGWNDEELSELEHWNVLDKLYNLTYEIKSAYRGWRTGAETAAELGQYIKDLADQLDSFGDEVISLGDSENIEESLNENVKDINNMDYDVVKALTKVWKRYKNKVDLEDFINSIQNFELKDEDINETLNESKPGKNPKYRGYTIKLEDRGGVTAYNVYDKHGELEDTGFRSVDDAKKAIDELDESLNESLSEDDELFIYQWYWGEPKYSIEDFKSKFTSDELARAINYYEDSRTAPDLKEKNTYFDPVEKPKMPWEESLNKSKKLLKEATVISDVKTFKPWNGAVATYEKIQEEGKLDQLELMIEEMYPDGIEAQTLNDLLWFDNDFVYQMLNIKVEEE